MNLRWPTQNPPGENTGANDREQKQRQQSAATMRRRERGCQIGRFAKAALCFRLFQSFENQGHGNSS
jgi:hypothetical protein